MRICTRTLPQLDVVECRRRRRGLGAALNRVLAQPAQVRKFGWLVFEGGGSLGKLDFSAIHVIHLCNVLASTPLSQLVPHNEPHDDHSSDARCRSTGGNGCRTDP